MIRLAARKLAKLEPKESLRLPKLRKSHASTRMEYNREPSYNKLKGELGSLLTPVILLALILAAIPSCSAIVINNVDGVWGTTPTPPGPTCFRISNTGDTHDENQIGYGNPTTSGCSCPSPETSPPNLDCQSGLGFNGAEGQTVLPGALINLGEFRHSNNPIQAPDILTGDSLTITLNIQGAVTCGTTTPFTPSFQYFMELDETDNGCYCSPLWYQCKCAYTPCSTRCPDKVSWSDTVSGVTFCVDGQEYTLDIIGFVPTTSFPCVNPNPDNVVRDFVTQERTNNKACLIGRLRGNSPRINVEKFTNNIDVTAAPGPTIHKGCPVTWTYYVTNSGNTPLDTITVTDNIPGVTPVYQSGDTGGSGGSRDYILGTTGETWIYTATGTAACSDYTNTATASGRRTTSPYTVVTDTDPSWYHGGCANAGPDIPVCEDTTNIQPVTITGTGTGDLTDTYTWTRVGGSGTPGTFSNPNSLTTQYTPSLDDINAGEVTLRLTPISECPGDMSYDEMKITIYKMPQPDIVLTFPL